MLDDRYCSSQVLKPKYFTLDKFINHSYSLFKILTAMESNIKVSGDLGPFPPCCSFLSCEKVQISLSLLNESASPSKSRVESGHTLKPPPLIPLHRGSGFCMRDFQGHGHLVRRRWCFQYEMLGCFG